MANQVWTFKLDRGAVEGLNTPRGKLKYPPQDPEPKTVLCESHSPTQSLNGVLPLGLIGPKCISTVIIEGVQCDSLLDSGSQVTTVSKFFHEHYLSHQPIFPIQDLLDIEGAGGQEVPYSGYIQVSMNFLKDVMRNPVKSHTLALVVPDHRTNMHVPLLIGTNTLDPLFEKCVSFQDENGQHQTKNSHCSLLANNLYDRFKVTKMAN